MTEIMRARLPGFLGPEYNDFLFAQIGADSNGGYLSVVSVLARLDLDPWAEAAKLAKLPMNVATQKLSSLIAALQEIPSARQESKTIAARLVALLPRGINVNPRSTGESSGVKAMTNSRAGLSVFLCAFALMLAFQTLIHSVQPPAPHPLSGAASNTKISNNSAKIDTSRN